MKIDWKKVLPHVVAICVFIGISMAYFYPAMQGNMIKSHDINMHKGMSKEIADHREDFGEEPLWTNSAYGGMPATQISIVYDFNLIGKLHKVLQLGLPHPISYLFLYMIGFYILLLCMKVDPWLALAGAIAYGLSSYFFIIMGAGHNSKAVAVAYMAPALGGFLLVFKNKVFLGSAILILFLSLQINANHLQVTYYFFILLFVVFLYYGIQYLRNKEPLVLIKRMGFIGLGVLLAILINIPNLYSTYEYAPYTQRAGTELEFVEHNGNQSRKEMSKSSALRWSYGRGETWNIMIPNIKGGVSTFLHEDEIFQRTRGNAELKEILEINHKMNTSGASAKINQYFGNQASTSGPVYVGAIVCFLFILGMIFWKSKLKWPLFIITILCVGLAWGKNLMWLTNLFWNYVPGYNKFRAVTIILVIVELTLPLVGFLWLKDIVRNKETYLKPIKVFRKKEIESKKLFLGVSGFIVLVILLFAIMPSVVFDLESKIERNFFKPQNFENQIKVMVNNNEELLPSEFLDEPDKYAQEFIPKLLLAEEQLLHYRAGVVREDAFRSLFFILLTVGLLYVFIYRKMKVIYFSLTLTLLLTIDLWNVSVRYLNNSRGENSKYNAWESKQEKLMPFIPTFSDEAIMNNEIALNKEYENKIKEFIDVKTLEKGSELTYRELDCKRFSKLNQLTNYRVLLLGNILREASISYFHKSLGGYHAAKIQRYQDFIEKKFKEQMVLANDISTLKNAHILHMLNTKYIILNQNENGKFLSQKDSVFSAEKKKAAIGFINDFAYGNAWFVNEVKAYNSPNDEFTALDTEDLRAIAITDERFKNNKDISGQYKYNGNETVKMISYKANEIKYSLENIIGGEHYMVFSEIYYPLGWKAYVNGDEIQINRVNYLLRGVKIPEGAKEVTLRYELKSFTVLSTISLISSILMILIIIGFGSFSFYKEKEGLRTL